MTNRELFKNLHRLHPCKNNNCIFRDPSFINNPRVRERIQQFNIRHGNKPKTDITDPSWEKDPPATAELPKTQIKAVQASNDNPEEIPFDEDSLSEDPIRSEEEEEEQLSEDDKIDTVDASDFDLYTPMVSAMNNSKPNSPTNAFNNFDIDEFPYLECTSDLQEMQL